MTNIYVDACVRDSVVGVGIYSSMGILESVSLTRTYNDTSTEYVQAMAMYEALIRIRDLTYTSIYTTSAHVVDCLVTRYDLYGSIDWMYLNDEPVQCHDIFKACGKLLTEYRKNGTHITILYIGDNLKHLGVNEASRLAAIAASRDYNVEDQYDVPTQNNKGKTSAFNTGLYILRAVAGSIENNTVLSLSELDAGYGNMSVKKLSSSKLPSNSLRKRIARRQLAKVLFTRAILPKLIKKNILSYRLFLVCIDCTQMIMITYPKNHILTKVIELDIPASLTYALTWCACCIDLHNILDPANAIDKFDEYTQSSTNMRFATEMFRDSPTHVAAEKVSGAPVEIKSRSGSIEYISVASINRLCKKGTKCQTLIPSTGQLLDDVKHGFLN